MKLLDSIRAVIAFAAYAALCACGGGSGSQVAAPISAPVQVVRYIGMLALVNGRPVTAARPRVGIVDRTPSLLGSLGSQSSDDYEYVINNYGTYASIFDYPKQTKEIGSIQDVGGQGCTNVLYGYGKNTFWIMAGTDDLNEYTVPAKPVKTLHAPAGANPSSCAMDASGDLAVGILYGSDSGDVVIYKHATGNGRAIPTPLEREYFDGYDDNGNLFFDGYTTGSAVQLDEIRKGSTRVQQISTSNTIEFPGSVQWDGTYLVVTDQEARKMYRYSVKGTKATLKDSVALTSSGDCAQTWIATGLVYCADAGNDDGAVYAYPKGGMALATFTGNFDLPLGTVAAAK